MRLCTILTFERSRERQFHCHFRKATPRGRQSFFYRLLDITGINTSNTHRPNRRTTRKTYDSTLALTRKNSKHRVTLLTLSRKLFQKSLRNNQCNRFSVIWNSLLPRFVNGNVSNINVCKNYSLHSPSSFHNDV